MSEQLGEKVSGRISILTHLRTFGYCFNPVTFYYLWADGQETPHAVMAEITNTPWGEKYAKCFRWEDSESKAKSVHEFQKNFMSPHLLEWMWNTTGDSSTPGKSTRWTCIYVKSSGLLFSSFVSETKKDFFPKSILCSLSFSLYDHKSNDGHLLECTTALA